MTRARHTKIFFATDLHGSDVCFRKLVAAYQFYHVDTVILGGDLSGKALIPLIRTGQETHESFVGGRNISINGCDNLAAFIAKLQNAGYYTHVCEADEYAVLRSSEVEREALLKQLITKKLRDWYSYAVARLPRDARIYLIPGNDDPFFVDDVLKCFADRLQNVDGELIALEGGLRLLSLGCSTVTPWRTPRELSEEEIEKRLSLAARTWDKGDRLVLNIHVPPYDSGIDYAPQINSELEVKYRLGTPIFAPVGSRAVRLFIERNQPLLGLFGHVHEAQGMVRLGQTPCVNPGSSFNEGLLKGCIITIEEDRVSCQFTTG